MQNNEFPRKCSKNPHCENGDLIWLKSLGIKIYHLFKNLKIQKKFGRPSQTSIEVLTYIPIAALKLRIRLVQCIYPPIRISLPSLYQCCWNGKLSAFINCDNPFGLFSAQQWMNLSSTNSKFQLSLEIKSPSILLVFISLFRYLILQYIYMVCINWGNKKKQYNISLSFHLKKVWKNCSVEYAK